MLLADDALVEQMERLEAMGVRIQELEPSKSGARFLVLVGPDERLLMSCIVRLEVEDQVREMLDFYEDALLARWATRH